MNDTTPQQPCLWWGQHRGKPIRTIDTGYLVWAAGNADQISHKDRRHILAELARRGVTPPPAPPGKPEPTTCPRCPYRGEPSYSWYEDRTGGKRIKRSCPRCGANMHFAPHSPENVARADANSTETPI